VGGTNCRKNNSNGGVQRNWWVAPIGEKTNFTNPKGASPQADCWCTNRQGSHVGTAMPHKSCRIEYTPLIREPRRVEIPDWWVAPIDEKTTPTGGSQRNWWVAPIGEKSNFTNLKGASPQADCSYRSPRITWRDGHAAQKLLDSITPLTREPRRVGNPDWWVAPIAAGVPIAKDHMAGRPCRTKVAGQYNPTNKGAMKSGKSRLVGGTNCRMAGRPCRTKAAGQNNPTNKGAPKSVKSRLVGGTNCRKTTPTGVIQRNWWVAPI
jgi:hypothetical protein